MINGEFPSHGAHLTVAWPTHRNEQGSPRAEDSGRIQIVAAIVTALLLRWIAISLPSREPTAPNRHWFYYLGMGRFSSGPAAKSFRQRRCPRCPQSSALFFSG